MPFWKMKYGNASVNIANVDFGIRLLFRNTYTHAFVLGQCLHETGMLSSSLYQNNNNCFGMGKTLDGKYQDGSTVNGVPNEPAYSAKYKSVYQSIYDYYDYCTNRFPKTIEVYDNIPKEDFTPDSEANKNYIVQCVTRLKNNGYFVSSLINYYSAIRSIEINYTPNLWRIGVNVVYTIFVPAIIVVLLRRHVFN